MEKLFTPHFGLMLWTIVTFLLLVFVLTKFGWGPLILSLREREDFLAKQRKETEEARLAAENLKKTYEVQLAEAQRSVQEMVNQARQESDRMRNSLLDSAKTEAGKIVEKGRRELASEAERLKGELRGEVAGLSVSIAEKILNRSLDKKVQDEVIQDSLKSIGRVGK